MTSEIISRNITNLIGELKFVILWERSKLAMQNKFNDGPNWKYSSGKVYAKYFAPR